MLFVAVWGVYMVQYIYGTHNDTTLIKSTLITKCVYTHNAKSRCWSRSGKIHVCFVYFGCEDEESLTFNGRDVNHPRGWTFCWRKRKLCKKIGISVYIKCSPPYTLAVFCVLLFFFIWYHTYTCILPPSHKKVFFSCCALLSFQRENGKFISFSHMVCLPSIPPPTHHTTTHPNFTHILI